MSQYARHSRIAVLNDMYTKTISMDDAVTSKAKQIVNDFVLNTFIRTEMREADPLFKNLFSDVYFGGSFYDGLRVGEATEFDLNIILNLPFYDGDFELINSDSEDAQYFNIPPAFGVYCTDKSFQELMPSSHDRFRDYKNIKNFFEDYCYSGYVFRKYKYIVRPDKIRSWFESTITKAMSQYISKNTSWIGRRVWGERVKSGIKDIDMYITVKKSGPAFTLHIQTTTGLVIDVDLVPVLRYGNDYLVPKPPQNPKGNNRIWRLSYPDQERRLIHEQSCAKKCIKLLKRFRDMQGSPWKQLASYYLKTIVMLQSYGNWHDREIDTVFIGCLRQLFECLEQRKIPFYFDRSCNLLSNLNPNTIDNMKGRLQRILRDIETNPPETLIKYFVIVECNTDTIDGGSSCLIM